MSEQMTEYKNGDTVRVVLEGKVVDLYADKRGGVVFDIGYGGMFIDISNEVVKSVEVLELSPLKVGDAVESAQYALLPVGTVVEGTYGTLWKLADDSWITTSGQFYGDAGLRDSRTIKCLPS